MAATVAGTFEDQAAARRAVAQLRTAGVPADDISMIVRDRDTPADAAADEPDGEPALAGQTGGDRIEPVTAEDYSATETGTATGGLIGALAGFLVGLGTIALPGLGAIVAAGPLAATLEGAAIGAATGGLMGALVDAGLPPEYATTYAHHVERGHVLLAVRTEAAPPERVREILAHAGAASLFPNLA